MNSRIRLPVLLLSFAAALMVATLVYAASVTVRVGSVEAAPGEAAEVPVTLEGSPGVSSMHLELTYDPGVLAVESVEQGSLVAGNALAAFNTEEPGRIVISLAAADEIAGDGTLAVAQFLVNGENGQNTALGLEFSQAWDGEGFEIPVELAPGQLKVVSSGAPLPLLIALAVVAIVLILLLILIPVSRRRRGKRAAPAYARSQPLDSVAPSSAQSPRDRQTPTSARKFCGDCGQPLEPGKRFCVHCGQPVGD
jgi:hypothetical protein